MLALEWILRVHALCVIELVFLVTVLASLGPVDIDNCKLMLGSNSASFCRFWTVKMSLKLHVHAGVLAID